MHDRTDEGAGDEETAAAFSLLGDATRLEIVTALYDADLPTPVGFADLYDRVDVDDTAQFNYHLDRLVPRFVDRVDRPDEDAADYRLTERGKRVARVITADVYTGETQTGPFPVEGACYACGEAALSGTYEDERFGVACEACGEAVPSAPVPPSVVRGRDPADVGEAVNRWARAQIDLAQAGSCPTCGGPVDPVVVEDVEYTVAFEAVAAFACRTCTRRTTMTFGALAYRHPAVETFYRRRGESLADRRFWELGQYVAHEGVEVVSRDPWLVRVTFHADGDACHVEVDGDLEVVRTEVVAGGAQAAD